MTLEFKPENAFNIKMNVRQCCRCFKCITPCSCTYQLYKSVPIKPANVSLITTLIRFKHTLLLQQANFSFDNEYTSLFPDANNPVIRKINGKKAVITEANLKHYQHLRTPASREREVERPMDKVIKLIQVIIKMKIPMVDKIYEYFGLSIVQPLWHFLKFLFFL